MNSYGHLIPKDQSLSDNVIEDILIFILSNLDSKKYDNENFYFDLNNLLNDLGLDLSSIPLNLQIQICLCVLSLYSCFLCEDGSKVNNIILKMMNDEINSKDCSNYLFNFIFTLKSIIPVRKCCNIKKYISVLYYLDILHKYRKEKAKKITFIDKSCILLSNLITVLRDNICVESVIETVYHLLYVFEKTPNNDVNWLVTCVDECINVGNIIKYNNPELFMMPMLWSLLNIYCESDQFNYSFLNYILSLTTAIICSKNVFLNPIKCIMQNSKLSSFSRYDDIKNMKMKNYLSKNDGEYYADITAVMNEFYQSKYNLKDLVRKLIDKSKTFISMLDDDEEIIASTSSQKTTTKTIRTIQKSHIVYDNFFSGTFVYFGLKKEYLKYTHSFTFLCELNVDINEIFLKDSTIIVHGPLIFKNQSKKLSRYTHWIDESFSQLTYYLDCIKCNYNFKNIFSSHKPLIVGIKNTNSLRKRMILSKKNLSLTSNLDTNFNFLFEKRSNYLNIFEIISEIINIQKCDYLIKIDPFNDYRLKSWNHDSMVISGKNFSYYTMEIENNIIYKDDIFKIFAFALNGDLLYKKLFKKVYIFLIFKSVIGVKPILFKNKSLIDFNIFIDNVRKKIEIYSFPEIKYNNPRFPPYNNQKRETFNFNFNVLKYSDEKQFMVFKYINPMVRIEKCLNTLFSKLKPIISEIYTFLDEVFGYNTKIPSKLRAKIDAIKIKNTYDMRHNKFSIGSYDTNRLQNYTIIGALTYAASKTLGLDSNIFGIDIMFLFKYLKCLNENKLTTNNICYMDIVHLWSWSIVNNTPFLENYDINKFNSKYVEFDAKLSNKRLPSINIMKGWILKSDENLNTMIKTLKDWIIKFTKEKHKLEHNIDENDDSYDLDYIPKKEWLTKMFWPQIISGAHNLENMYKKVQKGDFIEYCEYHYGYNYLEHYIRIMKRSIVNFLRDYDKRFV